MNDADAVGYRVVTIRSGCPRCGAGAVFTIAGPTGYPKDEFIGWSLESLSRHVDELNQIFLAGVKHGQTQVPHPATGNGIDRVVAEAQDSDRQGA